MAFRPRSDNAEPSEERERGSVRPGTITRLAPQRRAPRRFLVEIDGHSGLTLAEELVVEAGLHEGEYLDEATITALLGRDETARATEAALVFLSYRPRSEREVRDRLRRGGYQPPVIDEVIGRLHGWRYLDDADFARRWVEGRTAQRPRGRRLLQQELWQKGVDREIAREAIEEAELDEESAAEELARKRIAAYGQEDPAVIRRRVGAYLARRGYGFDVVRAALDKAMGEPEEPEIFPDA
ncbi:MAG: RecX family transcriptional regulator [Bauldia sp.]|nr:RecX family transcriptional regulator [Bauldia sp.]